MNNEELEKLAGPFNLIYQVWRSTDSCGEFWSWEDCDKVEYDTVTGNKRVIVVVHEED